MTEYKVLMAFKDPESEVKEVTIVINTIILSEDEVLDDATKEQAIEMILEDDKDLNKEHLQSTTFTLVE